MDFGDNEGVSITNAVGTKPDARFQRLEISIRSLVQVADGFVVAGVHRLVEATH